MSKLLIALSLVGFVAACAPKPEPMPAAPVTEEPVYTGKYK
ncbi:hypothetical protein [Thioclava indica]|uniref:Lipoprotein n=1 Tax=Thioclava indica TaxID=1353528 RepID=A0A074JZ77_9RHOB|nr:hypothetical protein [Thioclava indica]KEO61789.1 hypothetical protein DT23_02095 [Thioclava indica]